ncbi:FtsH protease activity modulator HflK [Candidatus Macondimonas diazotrophica]|jgi:membrane protease subunit HflK|uniref:Protein HflK n=1 Tax=Candidatus Macondimonas diazotrophica TaxID=2305248 RepID=A0A4Z0F7K0_9GAMM|nr:FtsH protease activity modulator HflK [Candidatus Macondimonas diazotrophica]NCU01370.1 FtsH protease activity modulator HflK [Candidatus Macondimonas diazotrophica]TFZ81990.1 FtsH protease activity modulator HflK [Candidatus Macondimonas diazotrophica]HBG31434.1 FtsH protease activity modulator HflK [Gammaproteobacteria bacterium]HBG52217.1 FtsH protease activity modulator HflK [Gammaproteobacteria bacterium]
MAWNEPGGRDPWGGQNRNSGGPPDLDELLKKLRQRLPSWGSGGGGGSAAGLGLLLAGVAVLWLLSGLYIIDPAERGVVLRFGEFERITTEGPRWHLPYPIERVQKVNVDSIRTSTHKGLMLTRDENIVNVEVAVQYRVGNARDFLFNVREPEGTLRDATVSAVREVVGTSTMDFVLGEGRSEVASRTQSLLQTTLDSYGAGLVVTSVNLQDAQPPEQVQSAFEDAIKAREDKQRIINEAYAYANAIVPEARGAVARQMEEAQAYRERRVAEAQGESDRFLALASEYRKAPNVMRERLYLETMEEVLRLNPKIMVNNNGGSNVMYLPLDKWLKQAPELAAPSSAGTAPADPARGTPRETPSRYERSSRGVVR